MASFDILSRITRLGAANLTIREQVRLAANPLDLRWPALAPRIPARSLKIRDLEKADLRLTAEYRAWNANGRELFAAVGPITEWEILPLTASKRLDERRVIELGIQDPDVVALVDNGVVADVDEWATRIADAVHRKLEAAFFQAWLTNTFTVMDAATGNVITTALGFDATRYVTAGGAWTNVTAFGLYVSLIQAVTLKFGVQPEAARMRDSTYQLIVASAPVQANVTTTAGTLDARFAERRIFTQIIVDERTYDKSTDGGTSTTPTYYVPTGKIGFQPPGGRIGNTHSLPASRGGKEITSDRRINLQDVTIWHTSENRGMTLHMEGENIAVPMQETQRTYVYDALA